MPEENGTARLDRIEKILEMFIADHDRFRQGIKDLLRAQVLQADEIDKLWKRFARTPRKSSNTGSSASWTINSNANETRSWMSVWRTSSVP
jgi:hypothetical protein